MKKIGVLICLVAILSACSSGESTVESITITVWEGEQNLEHVERLCKDFAIDYKSKYPSTPEIIFEFTPYGEGVTIEKLGLYGPTGEGADVLAFVHDKLGTAVQESLLSENAFPHKYYQDYYVDSISAGSIEGRLYGYPITSESQVIMYNKNTVSEEEVTSFENLLDSGAKLLWKINDGYYSFSLFSDSILYGIDGTDARDVQLNTTETIDNINNILTISNSQNIIMDDVNLAVTLMQDTAGADQIDAVISTPYLFEQIVAALGEENVGIAPLPTLNGTVLRPYSGFKMYGVNRYSKNPTIAHALAEYLTNEKSQSYRLIRQGLLPSLNTPEILQEVENNAQMSVYKQSLDNSIVMPNITIMGSKYWSNFENTMTEILRDKPTEAEISAKLETLQVLVAQ